MSGVLRIAVMAGVAALLPAGSAAAQGAIEPLKKDVRLSVGAGKVATRTARCPGGYVAVSGVVVAARRTATLASVPRGPSSWRFRIANSRKRRVALNAELRCLRLNVPSGDLFLRVGTAHVRRALVPAGRATVERVRCPRGQVPTGFGYSQGRPGSPATEVQANAVAPTRYGWYVGLENLGDEDAVVTVYGRCVQGTHRTNGLTHRMNVRRVALRGRLRRGVFRLGGTCPRGFWSVDTGYRFSPRASLFTISTRPTGDRGGRWYFASRTRKRDLVRAYLTCVDLRTRFR